MYVKKIVAQEDSQQSFDSSIEEFQAFFSGRRTEFGNNKVLAVKFCFYLSPDNPEDAEETRWFINPKSVKVPEEFIFSGGPRMPSELPPFLLILAPQLDKRNINVFSEYESFASEQRDYDLVSLSVDEHINAFLRWLEEN